MLEIALANQKNKTQGLSWTDRDKVRGSMTQVTQIKHIQTPTEEYIYIEQQFSKTGVWKGVSGGQE